MRLPHAEKKTDKRRPGYGLRASTGAQCACVCSPNIVCPLRGSYSKSKGPVLDQGARPGREHFARYLPQNHDVVAFRLRRLAENEARESGREHFAW